VYKPENVAASTIVTLLVLRFQWKKAESSFQHQTEHSENDPNSVTALLQYAERTHVGIRHQAENSFQTGV
jgi:hypothetical protein